MNRQMLKALSFAMICVTTAAQLASCGKAGGGADGAASAPFFEDIGGGGSKEESSPAGGADTGVEAVIRESRIPEYEWQKEVDFPDQAGYTDDTLVMNSEVPFISFTGQGSLYFSVPEGTESFDLYVNSVKVDNSSMTGGKSYEVDPGGAVVNGRNVLQVSDIRPAGGQIHVCIPYPKVLDPGSPDGVINEKAVSLINDIIRSDIEYGFSGAQLAVVKDGRLVYENAWGLLNSYKPDGTRIQDGDPVTTDTLFDLASNTKMYSVTYAVQYLVTREELTMDTRISDILGPSFYEDTVFIKYEGYDNPDLSVNKEWKKELTVRNVMMHQAGFPSSPGYHREKYDQEKAEWNTDVENILYSGSDGSEETRKKTLSTIFKTPLMYEPGSKTLYSDVDYMLLCFCIEKITGQSLDSFLKEKFWQPMGLSHICFNPLENGFSAKDCAATELCGNTRDGVVDFKGIRKDTIQGEVHDEAAWYVMGGVSGHAGMFANASDLAKLSSLMLTGGYGDKMYFSRNVIDAFSAPQSDISANWGVGWYRKGDEKRAYYFGGDSSFDTLGHQGWTGTLTMIDPEENLVIVYLTNKRNTPLTDKETDTGKFDGNYYTAATLGFVPPLICLGMKDPYGDVDQQLYSLLTDMVEGKFRLIEKEKEKGAGRKVDSGHPIVKAGYSLMEVYLEWSSRLGYTLSDERVQEIMGLMDSERDAEEIALLKEKFG